MRVVITAEDANVVVEVNIEVADNTSGLTDMMRFVEPMELPTEPIVVPEQSSQRRRRAESMLRNGSRAVLIALMGEDDE